MPAWHGTRTKAGGVAGPEERRRPLKVASRSTVRATAVAVVATALVAVAGPAAHADHAWESYHWARTSNPFTLKLVDSTTPDWDDELTASSADWTKSSVLDTTVASGADDLKTRKRCSTVQGQVRVCNAAYGNNGWLGIAEIWLSGSHITRARARMNDTYFSLPAYDDPEARRHVMCQEVGHTLGLDHQYTEPSCMDDINGLGDPQYVSPAPHDYEQLEQIYAHLDSSTTVTSTQGSGGKGNNGRKVTFVFWADKK